MVSAVDKGTARQGHLDLVIRQPPHWRRGQFLDRLDRRVIDRLRVIQRRFQDFQVQPISVLFAGILLKAHLAEFVVN